MRARAALPQAPKLEGKDQSFVFTMSKTIVHLLILRYIQIKGRRTYSSVFESKNRSKSVAPSFTKKQLFLR